jgi:hypothetical protein
VHPVDTAIGAGVLFFKKKWIAFERNEETGLLKSEVTLVLSRPLNQS